MAEKPIKSEKPSDVDAEFRRKAALAILGAYVSRHGGFEPAAMETHMRRVWEYADYFVLLENAGPVPAEAVPELGFQELPKGRPAHPSDEWAVIDGQTRKTGFVTKEDADFYASARPGARVRQVAGPGVQNVA
jgi:hypothetical protein